MGGRRFSERDDSSRVDLQKNTIRSGGKRFPERLGQHVLVKREVRHGRLRRLFSSSSTTYLVARDPRIGHVVARRFNGGEVEQITAETTTRKRRVPRPAMWNAVADGV